MHDGDERAVQKLWEHYYPQLVVHARGRLAPGARRDADEEDHVQEAFQSFFSAIRAGRYRDLENRENLWGLLVEITLNKVHDHRKRQGRAKRGGGRVRGESAFLGGDAADTMGGERRGIELVADAVPISEFAEFLDDECRELIDRLGDPRLVQIASLWLRGRSQKQIAGQLGCSDATVARKQDLIRKKWRRELAR